MAGTPPSAVDIKHSAFTNPLQTLLSHLPLLNTTLSSSPSVDSLISTGGSSPLSSVSSVYTASSEQSPLKSARSPNRDPSPSHKWTSFYHAYPPPSSRTSSRRRRFHPPQPPLLLQLRRSRSSGKLPRPDLEVYPAHGAVRKEKRSRLVIYGAHELSKEDLIITRYSADDYHNKDLSPLLLELNIPQGDGIVAILHRCGGSCPVSSTTPEEFVLIHGSAWTVAPLPTGGYTFTSTNGLTVKHAQWLPQTVSRKLSRAATNPVPGASCRSGSVSTVARASKFRLVTDTTGAAMESASEGTAKAMMDTSTIHVLESQKRNNKIEPSDSSGQTHLKALAVATGIWVAAREGWLELGPFTAEAKKTGNGNASASASGSSAFPAAGKVDGRRPSIMGTATPATPVERGRKVSGGGGMRMLRFMQRRRASE